jgi:hypothetical protein
VRGSTCAGDAIADYREEREVLGEVILQLTTGKREEVQYNLGNPTYMEPRYGRITENGGLLEKVGTNLLSCTAQHKSFRIDYHLTECIIIYLFYMHKFVL